MKFLFFLIFIFFSFATLFSQGLQVLDCQLQYSKDPIKKVKKNYYPAKEIIINSQNTILYKYRTIMEIKNTENKAVEAVVFQYAIFLKIRKNLSTQGVWTVPFYVDEIRISKLPPFSVKKIKIYDLNLQRQFSKFKSSNFEVEEIKIEIMKEPKKEDEKVEILSYIFPVRKI